MLKRIKMLGLVLVVTGAIVGCDKEVEPIDIQDTQQVQEMIEEQEEKDKQWANDQFILTKPEEAIEDYFNEVRKGVYEADLFNYYLYPETVGVLSYGMQNMEGDFAEDELMALDVVDLYWKTIGDVEVLEVNSNNGYEYNVTIKVRYQDLPTVLNNYTGYTYNSYEELASLLDCMKRELGLPASTNERVMTIVMVNPVLMERHGVPVDLPEVYDQWLISNGYSLDELLAISIIR